MLHRLVKVVLIGLGVGVLLGFLSGLLRRRPTPASVVYVPPRSASSTTAVGPHTVRLSHPTEPG